MAVVPHLLRPFARPARAAAFVGTVLSLAGCGQDASTPVAQADTIIFGRVAVLREAPEAGAPTVLEVRAGLPESLQNVMRKEGRTVPVLEQDLMVKVRVTPDTVCVVDMRPRDLDALRAGQEVAIVPAPGTSTMTGTKLLEADAAEIYDFAAYETRYLPRALPEMPPAVLAPADPEKINSAGLERSPLPLANGRVVYFAAGLLPIQGAGDVHERGAVRPGMRDSAGKLAPWAIGGVRPYRTAWSAGRWSAPAPVVLPGLADDESARVTWVNEAETECLAEVSQPGKAARLMAGRRASPAAPWGPLEPVKEAGGEGTGDGQRFGDTSGSVVWTGYDGETSDLWLATPGKAGQRLDPRINTMGPEWSPRVGPNTILYFCRGQRQLLYTKGVVHEVRLPGKQRRPVLEAAPTADGKHLFVRVPRFTPGEIDWDLAVATHEGDTWGKAIPLDEWRPE